MPDFQSTKSSVVKRYKNIFMTEGKPNLKTKRFIVWSNFGIQSIAEIKWYPQWRRFALFPYTGTVFDDACLSSIKNFIKWAERKKPSGESECYHCIRSWNGRYESQPDYLSG